MNIFQKLVEVRKSVSYLQKESQSVQYKYVGSSQVLGALRATMDELQLLLIPRVTGHKVTESVVEQHEKDTNNVTKRTVTYFTELDMTMTWINAEKPDEVIECGWYGQGVDIAGEKGVGKCMTYAEKYFMLKFFNIPTDKDDPDSFQAKHEDKPEQKETKTKAQSKPSTEQKPKQQQTTKSVNWPAFWALVKDIGYTEAEVHKVAKTDSLQGWSREALDVLVGELRTAKKEVTLDDKPAQTINCYGCAVEITEKVRKFSTDKYGEPLCLSCQQAKAKLPSQNIGTDPVDHFLNMEG